MTDYQSDLNEKWRDMDKVREAFDTTALRAKIKERIRKHNTTWMGEVFPFGLPTSLYHQVPFKTDVGVRSIALHIESTSNLSLKEWK